MIIRPLHKIINIISSQSDFITERNNLNSARHRSGSGPTRIRSRSGQTKPEPKPVHYRVIIRRARTRASGFEPGTCNDVYRSPTRTKLDWTRVRTRTEWIPTSTRFLFQSTESSKTSPVKEGDLSIVRSDCKSLSPFRRNGFLIRWNNSEKVKANRLKEPISYLKITGGGSVGRHLEVWILVHSLSPEMPENKTNMSHHSLFVLKFYIAFYTRDDPRTKITKI